MWNITKIIIGQIFECLKYVFLNNKNQLLIQKFEQNRVKNIECLEICKTIDSSYSLLHEKVSSLKRSTADGNGNTLSDPNSSNLMPTPLSVNSQNSNLTNTRKCGSTANYDKILQQNLILSASMDDDTYDSKYNHRLRLLSIFAKHNHKVFTVVGAYPVLKECLRRRNWIEKLSLDEEHVLLKRLHQSVRISQQDYESLFLSQLLGTSAADFVWLPKKPVRVMKNPECYCSRINRQISVDFTTKEGLSRIVNNLQQMNLIKDAHVYFPRSYIISETEQRILFLNDYHLTRCVSFIQHLYNQKSFEKTFSYYAKIPSECIDFALRELRFAVTNKSLTSSGIAQEDNLSSNREMYEHFDEIIMNHKRMRLCDTVKSTTEYFQELCNTFDSFMEQFPCWKHDGFRNIWILKPIDKHRGTGIVVMNSEKQIFEHVAEHPEFMFMVQKYIEHPFLIYKTKFDIRQFFLINYDGEYLHVWMYKTCYFKLSSQEFTMDDFHESIHLTNHAIQKNYKNCDSRSEQLPEINMWHLSAFLDYLVKLDIDPKVWIDLIYPGMIKNILLIVYASLVETDLVKNNFELYGADFMITEDLFPVLIEVNGTPDLSGTTIVSKTVCDGVMEDLCKVVLDFAGDKKASTGLFEHIIGIEVSARRSLHAYSKNVVEVESKKAIENPDASKLATNSIIYANTSVDTKSQLDLSTTVRKNPKSTMLVAKKDCCPNPVSGTLVPATGTIPKAIAVKAPLKNKKTRTCAAKRPSLSTGKSLTSKLKLVRSHNGSSLHYKQRFTSRKIFNNQFLITSACDCAPKKMIKLYTNRHFNDSYKRFLHTRRHIGMVHESSSTDLMAGKPFPFKMAQRREWSKRMSDKKMAPLFSANRDFMIEKLIANHMQYFMGLERTTMFKNCKEGSSKSAPPTSTTKGRPKSKRTSGDRPVRSAK